MPFETYIRCDARIQVPIFGTIQCTAVYMSRDTLPNEARSAATHPRDGAPLPRTRPNRPRSTPLHLRRKDRITARLPRPLPNRHRPRPEQRKGPPVIKTETTHTTSPHLNSTILSLEQQEQFFHGHLAVDTITVRPPYPPSSAQTVTDPTYSATHAHFSLAGSNIRTGEFYASDTPYYEADVSAVLVDAPPYVRTETARALLNHTSQAAAPFQGPARATQSLTPAPRPGPARAGTPRSPRDRGGAAMPNPHTPSPNLQLLPVHPAPPTDYRERRCLTSTSRCGTCPLPANVFPSRPGRVFPPAPSNSRRTSWRFFPLLQVPLLRRDGDGAATPHHDPR